MTSLKELLLEEEELNPKPKYKIYCDMDGVLTNFDERFEHFTGKLPNKWEEDKKKEYGDKKATQMFWDLIDNQIGIKFWAGMKWTPGGQKLWDFIKNYNPSLLTSPSRQETSRLGKNIWVKNNLEPKPKVIFKYSKEKHAYADENAIHIDDREDIISNWNTAGGIGILCPKNGDTQVVINKLKELGYE